MKLEPYAAALRVQDWPLLETLPCYVFVQRGSNVVYANTPAREILDAEKGDVLPVERVFQGRFPGFSYARSGSLGAENQGTENPRAESPFPSISPSNDLSYSSEFACQLRVLGAPAIPIRGGFHVLRLEPEAELLIVAVRSDGDSERGSPHFLEHLLDAAPEAIMISRGSRILHVNREFERLFGFSAEEAIGQNTGDILIPDTRRHETEMLEHATHLHGRASMETVRLSKSGTLIDVSILVAPIEISGVAVGSFVSYRDIRDRKQTDAKLQHDALHDPLTGLANRALFLDRLQLTMARQRRRSEPNYAVMFLDLDRFKAVNDSLGHGCGDDLLVIVASRLRACFLPEDTVARFGGDEFAILIEEVADVAEVSRMAERVQRDIRMPVEVYGHEVLLSASVGIAFGTLEHTTPEQVLRDADYAMYQAKANGHARHEVFDGSMHIHVAAQMQKERDLRNALENKEFEVWYQPIYQLKNGELEGFEALLRWRGSDGLYVPPQNFLPAAEETGLIVPIGLFVLEQAAKQLGIWAKLLPGSKPRISVNLSPRQFRHPQLLDDLIKLLEEAKVAPDRLRLEVPETAINLDPDFAVAAFQRMADLGLGVALDNFGAGLASMNHFARLPVDLVKVDRRLTSYLPAAGKQAAIIQTTFDLARLLQVRVLAEGIERTEQLEALRGYGCDLLQGHLFSPAVSAARALTFLESGRWPGNYFV